MDPRRSSRARTSQPAPLPHTNSTTSSTSLSRAERNTRSNNKTPSPQRSSVQRSVSMDDTDSNTRPESVAPRRSRRGNDNEKDEKKKQQEVEQQGQVLEEDVTRCICGHADYPGPPASIRDFAQRRASKAGSKDGGVQTDDPNVSDTLSDDVGNFFIQCDNCHVWQHGGCVGLTDESMSPEFYFCEECKPEFHKLIKASDGTKSTRYLPVLEASPARSSSLSSQATSRRKDGKRMSEKESTKRRATMNSRRTDEEDEMLRRAIEESKGETSTLGKRTRDDSEEYGSPMDTTMVEPTESSYRNKHSSKRQRTFSSSPSTLSKESRSPSRAPGDDLSTRPNTNGNAGGKRIRGAAARNHRDKEVRERQKEIAAQRAEAARKREARSERRRGEDSPPPTPEPTSSKLAQPSAANHKSNAADAASSLKPNASNHRKTGRPPARRGRLGRNQYTRDLPLNGESSGSPIRDHSNDANGRSGSPPHGTRGAPNGINGESGRSSRPKYHNPTRTSMNEMKRRVAAILEFVNRLQTERPSQRSSASGSDKDSKGGSTPNGNLSLNASAISSVLALAVEAGLSSASSEGSEKNFTEMAAGEMMETLTKELVQWQSLYGKHGEK